MDAKTAKDATAAAETAMDAGRKVFENAVKSGTETASKFFNQVNSFGANNAQKTAEIYEQAAEFGRENAETINAMSSALTSGFETLSKRLIKTFKETSKSNLAAFEKLSSAKTPQEFASIQMENVSDSIERSVSEVIELNQLAIETAAKTAAPVKARVETVMATYAKPAA
ncbi:MAG: phasin family protein [Rhodospirillaceae bacterium]